MRYITGPVDPTRIKPAAQGSLGVCRIGSGRQQAFKTRGSGRVGSVRVWSRVFTISRVGSGRFGSGRVGSRRLQIFRRSGRDPTRPVRFYLTREQPWKISRCSTCESDPMKAAYFNRVLAVSGNTLPADSAILTLSPRRATVIVALVERQGSSMNRQVSPQG